MQNIQVTHDVNPNNARSESSLVINPRNPLQMVGASKRFNDIHTYDFTLATVYSTDGGHTWHDSAALAMPGFTVMTDPTMAWDDIGNVFLVGLTGTNPPGFATIGLVVYKSTNGGQTWSPPMVIHNNGADDKQWAAGDGNPASPHHGNVYAVWDNGGATIAFARTIDHGATWVGVGAAPVGSVITNGSFFPEINVAADGTIYVVSISGNQIRMHVSADGGNTAFQQTAPPATGVTTLEATLPSAGVFSKFPVFPGGNFRVITDPTACVFGKTVIVAWADHREMVSRIYYARSLDGGATWTTGPSGQPLLTGPLPGNLQHFHPQIVIDPNGMVGCVFYEFGPKPVTPLIDVIMAQSSDGGASFVHTTVTDHAWNPTVDAPWSHGDQTVTFIGDYMGLDASPLGFYPLWTDTRTGIQELWTAVVPAPLDMQITCIHKVPRDDPYHALEEVGGFNHSQGIPFRMTQQDCIQAIVSGSHFYVIGADGSRADVRIFNHVPPGHLHETRYIATLEDDSRADNLLALPECPIGLPPQPPQKVTVPTVLEMVSTRAIRAIEAAGLKYVLHGPLTVDAWVHHQTPIGGHTVYPGTPVTLQMRTGPIP